MSGLASCLARLDLNIVVWKKSDGECVGEVLPVLENRGISEFHTYFRHVRPYQA